MSDIKKLIQAMDAIESKKALTESAVVECGGDMAPPTENPGNPVTISVSFNASGKDNVADLLGMLKNAGLQPEGPAPAAAMPMRMDIEKFRDVVDSGDKPSPMAQAIQKSGMEEWENEPNEQYSDHKLMTKDLSGGINRPKKMFKPAAKGDNPMAVESIKDRLYRELSEKKSKPDFLDMDKDGNKKEPMKKAIADKKKKSPVKESELGEISDKTRNSYVKKAWKSYDDAQSSGDKKTMSKRGRGLDSAYDSGIRSDKKRREANSKKGEYDYNFGYGESAVSEISKDTLGRYAAKAHSRGDMAARMSKRGDGKGYDPDMSNYANKRYQGVQTAINKLSGRARVNPKK